MPEKIKEILLRIIQDHGNPTITVIMKACYLIDFTATRRLGNKITNLDYVRYNYGPFTSTIYRHLENLITDGSVKTESSYYGGNEVVTYKLPDEVNELAHTALTSEEKVVVDEVLTAISGLGASILTQITYKTAPMVKLGATLGGDEHLGETLDLRAV